MEVISGQATSSTSPAPGSIQSAASQTRLSESSPAVVVQVDDDEDIEDDAEPELPDHTVIMYGGLRGKRGYETSHLEPSQTVADLHFEAWSASNSTIR